MEQELRREKNNIEKSWEDRIQEMSLTDYYEFMNELYNFYPYTYESFKPALEKELIRRGLDKLDEELDCGTRLR